ncbi:MAG: glycosyltransferase family 2 protein [Balneolaceae bacterium]|nr:glycosyltransferase family 2 protein [Balneolaceae bacterium]
MPESTDSHTDPIKEQSTSDGNGNGRREPNGSPRPSERGRKELTPDTQTHISVVVPLLDESESLPELARRIRDALKEDFSYEIIMVDDGSEDDSWQVIRRLAEQHDEVRGIRLQRNYGKSTALQAGFDASRGEYVVTMDADLQDDPREIPEMIDRLKKGCDLVSGWKKKRHDPLSKTIPSRFFNKVTSWVTGIGLHDFNCGLKAYRREVVEHLKLYGELHRYIPFLAKLEGYTRIEEQVVQHHPRKYGTTKFGLSRFMNGFLDLLTLIFVRNYLQRPMHFFGAVGFLFLFVGGVINAWLAVEKIFYGANLGDRPLLLLGVMLMVLGAQFFSIGFLGELIQKGNEKKQAPNIKDRV